MGIRTLLSRIPGVQVVGEAADGEELVKVATALLPDIVLTDVGMPRLDGIGAIARIHDEHPGIKLVVLSTHEEVDIARGAIAKGRVAT